MDGHLFSLRIFCEKRPGVFVKLMQALDVLGLDVVHANITTFRGLVLNVFNAEVAPPSILFSPPTYAVITASHALFNS